MQEHEVANDVRLDGLARDAMQAFFRGSHLYRHGGSPNCSCAHGTLRPQRDASAARLSRNIAPTRRQTARVMTTFEQPLPSDQVSALASYRCLGARNFLGMASSSKVMPMPPRIVRRC
jgi:hypothetical protein